MKKVLAILVVALLSTTAMAANDINWDGGAGSTSWFDAANWDPDGVPAGNAGDVIHLGAVTVDIAGDDAAFGTKLQVGEGGTGTLNIATDGTLSGGWVLNGYSGGQSGTINVYGTLTSAGGRFYMGNGGSAYYNVDGGVINGVDVPLWLGDKSTSYGELTVTNGGYAYFGGNPTYGAITIRTYGFAGKIKVDENDSRVAFAGDWRQTIYNNFSQFEVIGGTADFMDNVIYSSSRDVTFFVPEPATMILLGLGSLVCVRRKK